VIDNLSVDAMNRASKFEVKHCLRYAFCIASPDGVSCLEKWFWFLSKTLLSVKHCGLTKGSQVRFCKCRQKSRSLEMKTCKNITAGRSSVGCKSPKSPQLHNGCNTRFEVVCRRCKLLHAEASCFSWGSRHIFTELQEAA